jgi:glucose-1-phosphate thymidylyltransferase
MNEPNIVILAGGVSSRMKKAAIDAKGIDPNLLREAREKSKSMLSVGDMSRPFLDYILFNIEKAGYQNVVIVVGEKDPSIREYYEQGGKKNQFPKLYISYALQNIPEGRTKPLGTADALLQGLLSVPGWRGCSFVVCNSDNLYSVHALGSLLETKHPNALIDYDRSFLRFDQSRIEQFSVIRKDADHFLLDIIEKPSPADIETAKEATGRIGVSMNIFKLSYDMILPFLESIPLHPVRQEKELPIAVKNMAQRYPGSTYTIPLSEHVIDLTNQSDIPFVQDYLRKEFPQFLRNRHE